MIFKMALLEKNQKQYYDKPKKKKKERWQYAYTLLGWSLSNFSISENKVKSASVTTSFEWAENWN